MRSQTITVKRARRFRTALSPPEVALWVQLKGRKLGGYHFRRRAPSFSVADSFPASGGA